MAIFKKTAANSVITNFAAAFNADTVLTADTLIVDPGAFLISTNPLFHAVDLANTGAWTVTISGSVFGVGSTGISLASGNAAVSTITVTDRKSVV